MAGLIDAVLRCRADQYSGSGDWLNEATTGSVGDSSSISGATHDNTGDQKWDFDGTDDFIDWADDAELDFGASDPFTIGVGMAADDWTPAAQWAVLTKRSDASALGYELGANSSGPFGAIGDGTNSPFDQFTDTTPGNGVDGTLIFVRNVGDDDIEIFVNGVGTGSATTDSTTSTLANAVVLRLGARGDGANDYPGAVFSLAVIPLAFSDAEVSTLHDALLNQTAVFGDTATPASITTSTTMPAPTVLSTNTISPSAITTTTTMPAPTSIGDIRPIVPFALEMDTTSRFDLDTDITSRFVLMMDTTSRLDLDTDTTSRFVLEMNTTSRFALLLE